MRYLCPMNNKMIKAYWWFVAPKQWWLRHILFWSYLFSNYVFYKIGWFYYEVPEGELTWIGQMLNHVLLAYTHLLFAIPKFLFRQKIFLYVLSCIFSVCLFASFQNILYPFVEATSFLANYHYRIMDGLEILFQVTGLRLFVEFIYTQKKIQELKNENLETELAYLKSQLSPHFLFNTLNNIAVVSEKYPEKVTPIIIELSNVLRFQLYESEKKTVSLSKEIENVRQYLNLEAMRLNDATWEVREEGNTKGISVSPLLFLPFIENATKHSADPSGKVTIDVLFKIEDNKLTFTIKNSKPTHKAKQLDGGIGLKNIQRRLELLYPKKYSLTIKDEVGSFMVEMKINF
jgi:two-component system, LytTR family, sensor kinase